MAAVSYRPITLEWSEIQLDDINAFVALNRYGQKYRWVSSRFKLPAKDELAPIVIDLYINTLNFCLDSQLDPKQSSMVFAMVKRCHDACTSKGIPAMRRTSELRWDDDYAAFKDMLLRHSIDRPPYASAAFTFTQAALIQQFVLKSYFAHYLMYKQVFTKAKVVIDKEIVVTSHDQVPTYVGQASKLDSEASASSGVSTPSRLPSTQGGSVPRPGAAHAPAAVVGPVQPAGTGPTQAASNAAMAARIATAAANAARSPKQPLTETANTMVDVNQINELLQQKLDDIQNQIMQRLTQQEAEIDKRMRRLESSLTGAK
ncbi:hypothetical protein CXG81DRAFT_16833 [Caulochytrium protostelioides]|uniref:Uncharacterized protein n=1 Tax=Caulochytrium protostelioides TaxID=1555241 RepID=A0A4P9XDX2_9FUNG|nr:hypothetical protein CXG81DRAFT_16833 [Caulochytrium protostelioides]|eukprot:RKP03737.1 hypothetical protein CXG81DRAFT_16833 [Caulochytrium protostelioides]